MNMSLGRWVLIAAILGSSMAFIDATAVNVALPSIQHDLSASAEDLQWTVEVYALFLSAFMLIGGAFGDFYGQRRIFCIGIAGFALASLACALAQSMLYLNIARAFQGGSAALFTPGSLALISATFRNEERGKAIGTWAGFAAITGAIGPLLGGWIAQYASWRDVFLINVPIAMLVLAIALRMIPKSQATTSQTRIDIIGAVLVCMSLGGITYALLGSQNASIPWTQASWLIGSYILFVAFLLWETRFQYPMMPLTYFRNRSFATLNAYTFVLYAALGGSLFFVPFDLQNVQGYAPTAAGAAMLPFIVILFLTSRWSGGLVGKIGIRIPLVIGACLAAVGFFCYSLIGIGGTYWTTFFPAACLLGIGGTFFVTPLTTGVMSALDNSHAGIASGINNTISRIAGLLAIAVLGLLLSQVFYRSFDNKILTQHLSRSTHAILTEQRSSLAAARPPTNLPRSDAKIVAQDIKEAYTTGFQNVMRISACLSSLAALIVIVFHNPRTEETHFTSGTTHGINPHTY